MQTTRIRVEDIEVGDRHRAIDEAACDRLAASMKEIGLRTPISVRIVDMMVIDGQEVEGVPVLVTGRHRLEAAKRLGWPHIDCVEVDDNEIAAELWEIAENLHRLDLTKEQRDQHLRRYAELIDAREAAVKVVLHNANQPPSNPKGGRPVSVATKVAEETGLSYATVHRALNPPPPTPLRIPIADTDAVTRQYNAIVAAWDRACPEARERFCELIDQPIFDRTRAAG